MCWPLKEHLRFLQVIQVTTITATVDWKSKEILPSIKHCMCWEFFMFPQWETTPVHFTVEMSLLLCLCVHEMKWWSVRVMVCFSVSCFISIVLSPHVFSIFYFLFSHIVCPMIFTCAPLTSCIKSHDLPLSVFVFLFYLVCLIWFCLCCLYLRVFEFVSVLFPFKFESPILVFVYFLPFMDLFSWVFGFLF